MTRPGLDANIRSIAERKIKGTLADRRQKFGYALADLHSQYVKAGGTGGSAHREVIRDVCRAELRERFQAAWEILRSVAVDFNLPRSATTGEELKKLMREVVIDSTSDLRQAIELTKRGSHASDRGEDVSALVAEVLPAAEADVDLFVSATKRPISAQGTSAVIDSRKIFLSHAATDAPAAAFLKEEIERRLPGVSVFCSSYPGDIPLGFLWSPEIQRNLQEAGALILVATTRSIRRNWIWFESGVFWFERPIVICCGELTPGVLPPPLNERQATTLATAQDFKFLLEQLSQISGVSVADTENMNASAARLVELERASQSRAQAEAGWLGVEWQGKFLVCDGPLEELSLIDPESYQESMKAALEEAGFRLILIRRDEIGKFKDRGIRPVFVTDKKKWRKEVQKGDVILVAEPPNKGG